MLNILRPYCFCFALLAALASSLQGEPLPRSLDVPVRESALRQELLAMAREDQAVRIGAMQALKQEGVAPGHSRPPSDARLQELIERENKKQRSVDQKNRERLHEIIEEHGWPGRTLVGRDGALSAWLIVQHADDDVKFQEQCLKLLGAAPAGEVEAQHVAYLTDRVLVNEGKPQRYGTQMDNHFEPRPIEDPDNVDQRRAEVGLPPLAEYLQTAKEAYEKMASGEIDSRTLDE